MSAAETPWNAHGNEDMHLEMLTHRSRGPRRSRRGTDRFGAQFRALKAERRLLRGTVEQERAVRESGLRRSHGRSSSSRPAAPTTTAPTGTSRVHCAGMARIATTQTMEDGSWTKQGRLDAYAVFRLACRSLYHVFSSKSTPTACSISSARSHRSWGCTMSVAPALEIERRARIGHMAAAGARSRALACALPRAHPHSPVQRRPPHYPDDWNVFHKRLYQRKRDLSDSDALLQSVQFLNGHTKSCAAARRCCSNVRWIDSMVECVADGMVAVYAQCSLAKEPGKHYICRGAHYGRQLRGRTHTRLQAPLFRLQQNDFDAAQRTRNWASPS
ncbi:hypothetical protein JB92DRAFT_3100077 [Gautieria morchelliformis]|nr:hypothetical protein JB92DRAFT_3100077 [Gautieria morchelliformis]